MKFGLSDTVIKELQDVFRRHANIVYTVGTVPTV